MKQGETKEGEIREYILTKLKKQLQDDQINLYISSEGDLQSAVYFHLRNFLEPSNKIARRWFVQNKLTTISKTQSKSYPDIVISRLREKGQLRPFVAIELKETRGFKIDVLRKDVKKLEKLISRKNRFKYGFVIYVCLDEILVGLPSDEYANMWDDMVERGVYTDPKTRRGTWLIDDNFTGRVFPILINAFARKWYSKEILDFKSRDKKLRKYRD